MTRPLRIDVEGGWYHVMSRGIERREIFPDESYCVHFLELLGSMSERFAVEVHGYVLMGNHYHLILRTPCANTSRAMQWLNVSYSAWFNAKRERVGHVFQGRFRSTLIDGDGGWLLQASAYLHLNPVRVASLGLGKAASKAEALGLAEPDADQVRERLRVLREHRWSSYRAYGNYASAPEWLITEEILERAGGSKPYRRYVQSHLSGGLNVSECDSFFEQIAIGGRGFLERVRSRVMSVSSEQPDRSFVAERIPFERIVEAVESVKNERFEQFRDRYGDWGLAMVLYLARRRSGLTLSEIGSLAGGLHYKAVFAQVKRMESKMNTDPELQDKMEDCDRKL